MAVIKRFENKLGYTEMHKYEDGTYAVTLHSDFAKVGGYTPYRFKQDAVAAFQFNHYWLVSNEKNV